MKLHRQLIICEAALPQAQLRDGAVELGFLFMQRVCADVEVGRRSLVFFWFILGYLLNWVQSGGTAGW